MTINLVYPELCLPYLQVKQNIVSPNKVVSRSSVIHKIKNHKQYKTVALKIYTGQEPLL